MRDGDNSGISGVLHSQNTHCARGYIYIGKWLMYAGENKQKWLILDLGADGRSICLRKCHLGDAEADKNNWEAHDKRLE